METSVDAAEPPPLDTGASVTFDPLEESGRRLQDILTTSGGPQVAVDDEAEKTPEEVKGHVETDVSLILQRLSTLPSTEDRLDHLVTRFSDLAALWRSEQQKKNSLQQKLRHLLEERRCGAAARSQLVALCRDLQAQYGALREETLRRSREEEEKRSSISRHFQETLDEIQAQIETHSSRNDKLRQENANLTDKLDGLMGQYERREESLEKINKHQDLQHKLTEAKLQQKEAQLAEAEEKHQREKEYLLVQAADWKLQAKTLTQQATVMQAQLTLYAQKFDEFQATLAKSNEIYVRFKQEMDNMTEKMKKVEKEANLWKARFETCNKTLIDMIEERAAKGREFDLFVLKLQRLEKLCRVLQQERKGLYDKIRDVRRSGAGPTEPPGGAAPPDLEGLQELQQDDPVLAQNAARLRQEQARLQQFAAALLAAPSDGGEEPGDAAQPSDEDDAIVSAIAQFQARTDREGPASGPGETPVVLLEAPEPQGAGAEPIDPVRAEGVEQSPTRVREEVQHSAEPEPGKADPEPSRADPEPSRMDPKPEPGRADPEPGRADPEPSRADPEPSRMDPKPEPGRVDPEPGRVDPEPEPGRADPEPGRADPEPGRVDPEPEPGRADPEPGRVDPETEPGRVDPETEPGRADPEPGRADPEPGRADPEPEASESLKETSLGKPVLPVEEVLAQQLPSGPEPGESSEPPDGSTRTGKQMSKKKKKRNGKSSS